jgi:hypothetical protein
MHWRTSRQWHPRKGISRAKEPMLAAVQHILAQRAEFWPLSDRSIHYALLNDPPLRHAGKPDAVYANDRESYHDLTDLLSRAWPNAMRQPRGEPQSEAAPFSTSAARNCWPICSSVPKVVLRPRRQR